MIKLINIYKKSYIWIRNNTLKDIDIMISCKYSSKVIKSKVQKTIKISFQGDDLYYKTINKDKWIVPTLLMYFMYDMFHTN